MTTRNQWLAGARPKTLFAAIAPVIVGTAFAGNNIKPFNSLMALIVALGMQVGVNYANDYSDGVRGTDSDRVGPTRLVGSGAATAGAVRNAALISFSIASLAGFILAARSSWLLLAIGALSIIAAWTYTGGARPYGYSGLGEISVFIFFGLVATMGTYFVQVNSISREVFLASIAMGLLACGILVLNNLRDLDRDKGAGKRTLAVILGDDQTRELFRWLIFSVFALAVVLSFFDLYYLVALLSFPVGVALVRKVRGGATGEELIPLLAQTGRLQLLYSVLLSLGALIAVR